MIEGGHGCHFAWLLLKGCCHRARIVGPFAVPKQNAEGKAQKAEPSTLTQTNIHIAVPKARPSAPPKDINASTLAQEQIACVQMVSL